MITIHKFTTVVCLILLSLHSFAQTQTKESKELYVLAVELYNQGKYEECIPLFLKVDSIEFLGQQRTSYNNHWVASAYYKLGDEKQAVVYSNNFAYQLPVVDRRQTTKSDSLSSIAEKAFIDGDYRKCYEYFEKSHKMLLKEDNEESPNFLFLESNMAVIYYLLGKKQEGIDLMNDIVRRCSSVYGTECLYQYYLISSFYSIVGICGDRDQMEILCQKMFELLHQHNVSNPYLMCEINRITASSYLQSNQVTQAKEYIKSQFGFMITAYGKESAEYINQLIGWSSIFHNIKDYEYSLALINEAEELTSKAFGRSSSLYQSVITNKIGILQACGQYQEAEKYIKISSRINRGDLDGLYAQLNGKTIDLSTQLQTKLKLKEKDVKGALALYNTLLDRVGTQDYTLSVLAVNLAILVAQNDSHLASQLVDRHLNTILSQNSYAPIFIAGMVYLSDELYVKARQANSAAMQKLHASLENRLSYEAAIQSEAVIDNSLKFLDKYKNKGYTSDTIGYSVAMIRQDLLYSKVLVLEQKNCMNTQEFFNCLRVLLRTTYHDTKDVVMGDSIYNRYYKKFIALYGQDSELYEQLSELKERVQFEVENFSIVSSLEYFNPITLPELYNNALEEYNNAYEQWKRKRTDEVSDNLDNHAHTKLKISEVRLKRNFKEGLEQFDLYLKDELAEGAILVSLASWCECAESLGLECQILPKLKELSEGIDEEGTNVSLLLSIAYIYRSIDIDGFDKFTKDFLSRFSKNDVLEYKVVSQLQLLSHTLKFNDLRNCEPDSIILSNLQNIVNEIKSKKHLHYDAIALDFLISRYKWMFFQELNMKSREELLPHFLELYNQINRDTNLQYCSASYQVLNMLCSLTTQFSTNEKTQEVDRLRRVVQSNCKIATLEQEYRSFFMHTDLSMYMNSYLSLYAQELKELERAIMKVYESSDYSAHFDHIVNEWDKLREMQHEGYYSDEKLSDAVENLSKESGSYLGNDSLTSLAYDIALFSKGYLLRSEQRVAKVIEQSGNRTMLNKYRTYLQAKQQLDDSSISSGKADSLRAIMQNTLTELRRESKRFDDYTIGMECSWREVQAQLDDDEIAIEYVFDGWRYHTIFIKKGFNVPTVDDYSFDVEFSIQRAGDSLYTSIDPIYGLWPFNLVKYNNDQYVSLHPLEGVKRIYFAPTGALHHLSMENLISDNGQRMCERYEMHRLTSTREIINYKQKNQKPRTQKAVLFGGVVYDFDDDDWQQVVQQNGNSDNVSTVLRDVPILTRAAVSSLDYLPGTLTEVTDIHSIIESNSTSSIVYTGKSSTEESFKSMSGTDASVLHIATHGYYQREDSEGESLINNSGVKDNKESSSMSRSGLFLAGASSILEGETIPQNVEDGILTAREISTLNLTNVSLVTLSACESGLGDVSSDGVFGLQRGFKKAGANSILMSLWKVDDKATCKLMTEFYSNWIGKKMTKHDALEAAKKTVRETKGWEDPKYWAAFILLDGLD